MEFRYTFRDVTGALKECPLEASNRAHALQKLSVLGIRPLSIREGIPRPIKSKISKLKILVFLLLLFAGVSICVLFFDSPMQPVSIDKISKGTETRSLMNVPVPGKSRRSAQLTRPKVASTVKAIPSSSATSEIKPKIPRYARQPHKMTEADKKAEENLPVDAPAPRNADGKRALFQNHVMLQLAQYATAGVDMPPPELYTDEQVLHAASMKMNYRYDDTDDELETKAKVADFLQEVKIYIENGGHAADYFKALEQRQSMEAEAFDQVRRDVQSLYKAGKDDEAEAALKKYNDYLESKGFEKVYLSRRPGWQNIKEK